jgi:hypothetical protein
MKKFWNILGIIVLGICTLTLVTFTIFDKYSKNLFDYSIFENHQNKLSIPAKITKIDTLTKMAQGRFGASIKKYVLVSYSYTYKNKRFLNKDELEFNTKYDIRLRKSLIIGNRITIEIDTIHPVISNVYLK